MYNTMVSIADSNGGGSDMGNGSWSGGIGLLVNKLADFYLTTFIYTPKRAPLVDWVYMQSCETFPAHRLKLIKFTDTYKMDTIDSLVQRRYVLVSAKQEIDNLLNHYNEYDLTETAGNESPYYYSFILQKGINPDLRTRLVKIIRISIADSNRGGANMGNGSWSGAIGLLVNKMADLYLTAFVYNTERAPLIDWVYMESCQTSVAILSCPRDMKILVINNSNAHQLLINVTFPAHRLQLIKFTDAYIMDTIDSLVQRRYVLVSAKTEIDNLLNHYNEYGLTETAGNESPYYYSFILRKGINPDLRTRLMKINNGTNNLAKTNHYKRDKPIDDDNGYRYQVNFMDAEKSGQGGRMVTISIADDNSGGMVWPNGSSSGAVGLLYKQRADFLMATFIYDKIRAKVLDYGIDFDGKHVLINTYQGIDRIYNFYKN
ncbi:unnamed protein product [Medioppia subpectinata]|uniref:Uncharacterized protein n=1 Tax=Medioppia subpectinata TaxID=1979941 RepID=A0A7R9KF21_9ACAR|nr:unnamed protein product [Medioppia subpectinata]CAG2101159.1 unnamed protein product [Medioppia subpectinata]